MAPICTRREGGCDFIPIRRIGFKPRRPPSFLPPPLPSVTGPPRCWGWALPHGPGTEAQAQQTQPRMFVLWRRCRRRASPPFEYLAGRRSASSDAGGCPGQAGTSSAEVGRGHVLVVQAAAGRLPHAKPPVRPRESQQASLVRRKGTGASRHVDGALESRRPLPVARRSAFSSCSGCCRHGARCRPGPLCSQQAGAQPRGRPYPPPPEHAHSQPPTRCTPSSLRFSKTPGSCLCSLRLMNPSAFFQMK